MALFEIETSPKKKMKVDMDLRATKFAFSPMIMERSAALAEKARDPEHMQIRIISSHEISTDDASLTSPVEYEICVAPHDAQSNNTYEQMKESLEELKKFKTSYQSSYNLYMDVLSTTRRVCAVDLLLFLAAILDYHVRRLFFQAKMTAVRPAYFQAKFIGKSKVKPFKTSLADHMKYMYLLKAADYLRAKKEGLSFQEENLLQAYEDLLHNAEEAFITTMEASGLEKVDKELLCKEFRIFFRSSEKGQRDFGAHPFTQMIWKDGKIPLEKQSLEDPVFPPRMRNVFDLTQSVNIFKLGMNVIILEDLESKLDRMDFLDSAFVKGVPHLNKTAIGMMKFFIQNHAFRKSMKFLYGDLSGTLVFGSSKDPPIEVDLKTFQYNPMQSIAGPAEETSLSD